VTICGLQHARLREPCLTCTSSSPPNHSSGELAPPCPIHHLGMASDDSTPAGDLTFAASTESAHRGFLSSAAVDLTAMRRPSLSGQLPETTGPVRVAVAPLVTTPLGPQNRSVGTTAAIPRFTGPSPPCPRCHADGLHTKFCYYNNHNVSQPRFFCKVMFSFRNSVCS
jgi:hypothetical protein